MTIQVDLNPDRQRGMIQEPHPDSGNNCKGVLPKSPRKVTLL